MQFVKTADLKPGMRLAKPIYNKMGVLLYERDTKLTPQGINSVVNFGLIGIFILEPAEPVPPLTAEELEFEQFQTIYMFKLKESMDKLQEGKASNSLRELVQNIYLHYGTLDHKLSFTQNLRSSADFVYKHSISVGILVAILGNALNIGTESELALISAALLYDFGYLYVPQKILERGEDLEKGDRDFIQVNLERGYETIKPHLPSLGLPKLTLEIIQHIIFDNSVTVNIKDARPELKLCVDILKVADKFDRLTAMNINKPPVSELVAMAYFRKYNADYDSKVLAALADCIHILPTGACLDFSTGEKGLVVQENPDDFLHPMVLKFSNNQLYDLSDPKVAKELRIVDIMKTMDNRIAIDEETLKQFVADERIKETADRFRKVKMLSAQERQKKETTKSTRRVKLK